MKYLSLIAFLLFIALPAQAATIPVSSLTSGDLIRGASTSAVYYFGNDGMRYVFPNDKTYFTWYQNFNAVKWLSDADLATIQIGGNVTYKPGIKMIKIQSDPTVYAISANGTLRGIENETVATELYGTTWNKKIDDVPDGFFSNYQIGSPIELQSQYDMEAEMNQARDINTDKELQSAFTISINNQGYNPSTLTITPNRAVRFVNNGTVNNSATEWDHKWGSGTLKPGQHFTRYFRETDLGRWSYYSTYTAKDLMQGTLFVQE